MLFPRRLRKSAQKVPSLAPPPPPKKREKLRDFNNEFPPKGEIWVIEEVDWRMTGALADPGEVYARYTVKTPGMSTGDGGSVYASGEALHKAAVSTLTQQLTYQPASRTFTIRFFVYDVGDKARAMQQQQDVRQQRFDRAHQFYPPKPKYT